MRSSDVHDPPNGRVVLGPAMRVDLMIEMFGGPGASHAVRDSFYPTSAYTLSEIVYGGEAPLRREPEKAPGRLPPNTMPEPVFDSAEQHEVAFGGGMMGMMNGGMMRGGMMGMMSGRSEEHTSELHH